MHPTNNFTKAFNQPSAQGSLIYFVFVCDCKGKLSKKVSEKYLYSTKQLCQNEKKMHNRDRQT